MKIYTIIGGVNGVGKSSFTGVLKEPTMDLGTIVDVCKITAELEKNTLACYKAARIKIREFIFRVGDAKSISNNCRKHNNKYKRPYIVHFGQCTALFILIISLTFLL